MSKPEVFVIESLRFGDERADRFEGQIISKILRLSGKHCIYYYIRTRREFERVMRKFAVSGYRYLHISCHGNRSNMATTLDSISFADFAAIVRPHIQNRRLFLSACSMANDSLARLLMPDSGCYSMLGPDQDIAFNDAAILWASLYHMMFAQDSAAMQGQVLRAKAQAVANMYRVRLSYFGRDRSTRQGYVSRSIVPADETVA